MPCELSGLGRQRTGFCQFGPRGGPFDVSISPLTLFPDADDSHGHRGRDEDDQDVTVLNGDANVILFKNNSSVSVLCLSFVSIEHLSMWQLWQGGCFEKSLR